MWLMKSPSTPQLKEVTSEPTGRGSLNGDSEPLTETSGDYRKELSKGAQSVWGGRALMRDFCIGWLMSTSSISLSGMQSQG